MLGILQSISLNWEFLSYKKFVWIIIWVIAVGFFFFCRVLGKFQMMRRNPMLCQWKAKWEDPDNYKSVSLTLVSGKIMEWFLKDSINKELNKGNIVITNQHGFIENRPCQISLVSFLWYYKFGWCNEVL